MGWIGELFYGRHKVIEHIPDERLRLPPASQLPTDENKEDQEMSQTAPESNVARIRQTATPAAQPAKPVDRNSSPSARMAQLASTLPAELEREKMVLTQLMEKKETEIGQANAEFDGMIASNNQQIDNLNAEIKKLGDDNKSLKTKKAESIHHFNEIYDTEIAVQKRFIEATEARIAIVNAPTIVAS